MVNTFALSALSILACGYIIYDAPICRRWWSRYVGYVLYFRIIVAGLFLVLLLTLLLDMPPLRGFALAHIKLGPEHAPILAFLLAIGLRILAKIFVLYYGKLDPEWLYRLDLKSLSHTEIGQIVYEKIRNKEMIMITLKNNKVYAGWPTEVSDSEYAIWLRLAPRWSGYRDEKYKVCFETDYSKVYGQLAPAQEHMLISVGRIITVQPFDPEVFEGFNPEFTADDMVPR